MDHVSQNVLDNILWYKCPGDHNDNRVDIRGDKYVFGPTQTNFSPSEARVKMSLRRAERYLHPTTSTVLLL